MADSIGLSFKDRWVNENVEKMLAIYPNDNPLKIRDFVLDEYDSHFNDPACIIYNNYEKEQVNTSISKLIDWMGKVKPITTESGSIFKQHSQAFNPDTQILQSKLDDRKIAKAKKFEYKELSKKEEDKAKKKQLLVLSNKFDLTQKRDKIIVNSEYGVSGLSSSWFFNMACASATTARGQALISTAMNAFEDFLGDNVRFLDNDECITFIMNVTSERANRRFTDDVWVENKYIDDVTNRLRLKYMDPDSADITLIATMLSNLSQEDLNRVYYKSNLYEFIRNSKRVKNIISTIAETEIQYLEPMKPPKEFLERLKQFREVILEYVHYCHPTTDRVYRLKSHKRKCVITIDQLWVDVKLARLRETFKRFRSYNGTGNGKRECGITIP